MILVIGQSEEDMDIGQTEERRVNLGENIDTYIKPTCMYLNVCQN